VVRFRDAACMNIAINHLHALPLSPSSADTLLQRMRESFAHLQSAYQDELERMEAQFMVRRPPPPPPLRTRVRYLPFSELAKPSPGRPGQARTIPASSEDTENVTQVVEEGAEGHS